MVGSFFEQGIAVEVGWLPVAAVVGGIVDADVLGQWEIVDEDGIK